MEIDDRLITSPNLEMAIDRKPLKVTPDTSIQDVIIIMSQAQGSSCSFVEEGSELESDFNNKRSPSSYALVMEQEKLLGIVTERDIVRLTALAKPFEGLKVSQVMTHPVVTLSEDNFRDIFAALFLFRRYKIRHLPLIDRNNNLIGVISPGTIRQAMRPANLLKLRRVGDVMSKEVVHEDGCASVLNIARLMADRRVSCVVITQEDREDNILLPAGIITERDIMQFQSLQLDMNNLAAQEVMSSPLFLLRPEDSLLKANKEMELRRVRRLIVSWNWGQGLGIITQSSLLRIFDPMEMYSVINTLQTTIQKLETENQVLSQMVENQ